MQSHVYVRDARAGGVRTASDALVRRRVGDHPGAPSLQVPAERIGILIEVFGRPPGTSASSSTHGLAGAPGALFVTQHRLADDHIAVGDPEVGLLLEGFAIKRQGGLRWRAEVAERIGPIVQQIRPILDAGGRIVCLGEGHGLGVAPSVGQVNREQRRLGLAVDVFGGLGRQLVEIARGVGEHLGQEVVAAHGQGQAATIGLHQVALDVQVVAEPGLQHAVEVAQRQAGLGHLHLDVAGPGVGQTALGRRAPGGRLQAGKLVEQATGHHLGGEAPRQERRRSVEGLDHHRTGGESVIDHYAHADADQGEEQGRGDLHAVADALAESAQLALAQLALQMGEAQRALLLEFGDLGGEQ